jgi:hypothetical protein
LKQLWPSFKSLNFLKLPSGRHLQPYRQFDQQESGWNYENINQMNQDFKKYSYSIQSKLGVLIFDEMKIKETLICSQHNNKLSGFTDIECMQDRSDKVSCEQYFIILFQKCIC